MTIRVVQVDYRKTWEIMCRHLNKVTWVDDYQRTEV